MIGKSVDEKIVKIKQSFRLMMNGEASRSMRGKGLYYKVNWGVGIPALREMAREYGKDYDLAIALWNENIRECKILATMIMPPNKASISLVDTWMEQTNSQEIAEMGAFFLYQYLDYASELAYKWIYYDKDIYQICAYKILTRLFMKGKLPNDSEASEFLNQAYSALRNDNVGVWHSALTCVQRFIGLGDEYYRMADEALKPLNLDIFERV